MLRRGIAAMALLLVQLAACKDSGGVAVEPPAERAFVFGMRGIADAEGRFVAVTSDPIVLAKLEAELALPAPERLLHIHGSIARGNGGHNLTWSWHFVPESWDLVEISVEVCDGTPRMVEADVASWVDKVGTFCPWSSYVQSER